MLYARTENDKKKTLEVLDRLLKSVHFKNTALRDPQSYQHYDHFQ